MASSTTSSSMSPRHVSSSPTAAQSRRQVSSPWTQIVRGESEPPPIAAAAAPSAPLLTVEAAAGEDKSEGNAGKKPVWNRPSNGASEIGPVMGASSWPALSEASKAPSNKPSSDSSLGDVPSSVSQGAASASAPAPKQVGRANNPNPTPNHSRQRSFKRNGASGSTANGTASQPSSHGSLVEGTSHNPSPRGQNQNNGFASQPHGGADNQRDSHRNQNGNHHHQNHGGRRNQEHGNHNWNFHRTFNGRDGNAQSPRGAPAFVRYAPPPPPPPVQAITPQFMAAQSFGSPVPYPPELAPPFYPGIPFVAPLSPGPVFYHVQDPPLNIKLQNQIHYYFSEENLIKDTYLRDQMDDQGFAPLHVIAGFRKVNFFMDVLFGLTEQGQRILIARGGEGGLGSVCATRYLRGTKFAKTSPLRTMEDDEDDDDNNGQRSSIKCGSLGTEAVLILELKSIADVGLVGMPNAGKSTLLGALSRAKPRVGHYAFTTLRPNLGNVSYDDFSVTVADIPGLIKGAHQNRGLGHNFLRHIERTKVLAYVVDLASGLDGNRGVAPWQQLRDLVMELEFHEEGLSDRSSLIVANKIDEKGAEERLEELERRVKGVRIFPVCAVLEEGVAELKDGLKMLVNGGGEGSERLKLENICVD